MEIIHGVHNLTADHIGNVITIGNFDGVHHGHQVLLHHLTAKSNELKVPSLLVTFEPQPREFFAGSEVPPRLTRLREKVHLLQQTNLDRLLLFPFNERTANTPAQWIAEELLSEKLGAKYVVIGDDFRFGQNREGDYEFMKAAGSKYGYGVSHLGTLKLEGERVSSTRVREVLAEGNFKLAEKLLGHEYFIMGRVVYGRQLGRQLGVPTANIRLQRYKAALEGVYCVTVEGIDDNDNGDQPNSESNKQANQVYTGIANIGVRPTVDGKEPLLEVHVFDYSGNLYNQLLTVKFQHKLRDEQTFESIDALKAQIDNDLVIAKTWFENNAV